VLAATAALGSLEPTTGSTLTESTVSVRLRSNKAYKLTAQSGTLAVTGGGTVDGGSTISLGDIGFGVREVTRSSGNVVTESASDTITASPVFDYTSGYPSVTNGLTPFSSGYGTLDSITSSVQVLTGNRISKKGNMSTDNNFIVVKFGVATLPQYFTPNTSFTTSVTLTIGSV
jgi:hypothetical protein